MSIVLIKTMEDAALLKVLKKIMAFIYLKKNITSTYDWKSVNIFKEYLETGEKRTMKATEKIRRGKCM